ncbi:MAG: hypothetical protein ACD_2C00174G0011 [uncultured bacterium (gcode 4)]|uniref:HAD family hydrolase n=1 Tax=uncultured bacterium (gcode 4) TaxID=1234023 RepID=K2GGB3_9BACT|nr:MAG: hypothetical protein ACD_2C00174G0011 [uncultured bacterium (gcode 4)]
MIKNLIFDWSWTLSNDLDNIHAVTMNVFEKLGLSRLSLDEYKKEFTLPYMNFYRKFKKDATREEVDGLFMGELRSIWNPSSFEGVLEILEFLESKNIRLSILSSHPQEKLEQEIEDYWFAGFFQDIYGSVPDKIDALKNLMKTKDFKPEETAFAGDMIHDIEAWKEAGIITIAATWWYQTKESLSDSNPDFMIDDIAELKKLFV